MSKEPEKTKHNYYYLSLKTKNIQPIIRINGSPDLVDYEEDDVSYAATLPVNLWLMEGRNRFTITMNTVQANLTHSDIEINAELFLHDPASEFPKPLSVLFKFNYPETGSTESRPLAENFSADFTVTEKMPTKLWRDAEELSSLSATDKSEIMVLITELQNTIQTNNNDQFLSLFDYKIQEDALAEGKPTEKIKAAFTGTLAWLHSQGELEFAPIEKELFHFAVSPNNKLVTVTRDTGHDAISISSDELEFDLPVSVALIDSTWKIVR